MYNPVCVVWSWLVAFIIITIIIISFLKHELCKELNRFNLSIKSNFLKCRNLKCNVYTHFWVWKQPPILLKQWTQIKSLRDKEVCMKNPLSVRKKSASEKMIFVLKWSFKLSFFLTALLDFSSFLSWQFHFRSFQLFIFYTVQSKAKNWEANFHTNFLNGHKIFTNEPLNQLTKYYPAKATVYGSVRYNTGFRWVKPTFTAVQKRDFCHKSRQSIVVLWNNITKTEVLLH